MFAAGLAPQGPGPYVSGMQADTPRPVQKSTGAHGWGMPQTFLQEWPGRGNGQLPRMWSPGLGSSMSVMSQGWPMENMYAIIPIPRVRDVNAALMQRGSVAALRRPGGGSVDWGSSVYIPATPSRINYSRVGG